MVATRSIGRKARWLGFATLVLASFGSTTAQAGLISQVSKKVSGTPTISGSPASSVIAGSAYQFVPTARDPNGDPLTFRVQGLPRWATFSTSTGKLSGLPSLVDVGRYNNIRIYVSDGKLESSKSFSIKVLAGSPPTISGTPATSGKEGVAYSFTPTARDTDKQALTFAIINKPSWAGFSTVSGQLSGTPPAGSAATYSSIGISVTDGASTVSLPTFSITVGSVQNHPPVITGTPPTTEQEGQAYSFRPTVSDADNDPLRFYITNKPSFLNFDTTTGQLSGTAPSGSAGTYANILVSVGDGKDVTFLPAFSLTVSPPPASATPNTAPTISGTPPTSVATGQMYSFRPSASDPDNQSLAFGIANKPSWASFSTATGQLSGTPASTAAGTYSNIIISVSDGIASSTLPAFSINVVAANRAPTISGSPATSVTSGQAYSFTPSASDPDGQAVSFSISGKPSWASFNTATGQLSGTPAASSAGTYSNIVISVSDGSLSASLPAFSINVVAANRTPTISGSPATSVTSGQAYSFTPSASDPDGQAVSFSISGRPSWASFNTATGQLSGTPAATNAGTYSNIVISASDGSLSASLPAFSITVVAANRAPTISGSPATSVTSGQAYSFTPTASDPDGQTLAFGIANKPSWATFSTTTGQLSGAPASTNAGTYSNIVISVSDGTLSATLSAFSITVVAANRAPTISGTPTTSVTTGQAYSFTPTASDPDGQTLAFGIANKPSWATFNTATGKLSGTPSSSNTGTYSNIVISVSDGSLSATLPAFGITVTAPVTGVANLSWTAPTLNSDGTPLTNLAGYKVRYGTSPTALTQIVDVAGAGVTSASIEGLSAGTWYFTLTSYNNTGVESAQTPAVSFTVP